MTRLTHHVMHALGNLSGVGAGCDEGIAAILIIGYLNHNNIKLSSTVIGILMILEATFVAAVAIVIVIQGGHLGHFSATPFDPRAATAGFAGLSLAAIFAFLSIAGVDSVAPVAEEAHTPRRLIPLAWAVIGIFWALWWARRRHLASISLSAEV